MQFLATIGAAVGWVSSRVLGRREGLPDLVRSMPDLVWERRFWGERKEEEREIKDKKKKERKRKKGRDREEIFLSLFGFSKPEFIPFSDFRIKILFVRIFYRIFDF